MAKQTQSVRIRGASAAKINLKTKLAKVRSRFGKRKV